jgi:hypothetical protein
MSFLEMLPSEVPPQLKTITDLGESLDRGWTAGRAAIEAGEGGIGNDLLAAAFRTAYLAAKQAIEAAATPVPAAFHAIAAGGQYGVQAYDELVQHQSALLVNR